MKKLIAIVLCMALLLGCVSALAENAEQQTGVYTIYNMTGEKVLHIQLTDNVTGACGKVTFEDGGLPNGASVVLTQSIPAGEDGSHRLTLTFTTESFYQGVFETLSIEEAPIYLLAQDAMTGATPISFIAPVSAPEKEILGQINLNGAFTLKCNLPVGYEVTPLEVENGGYYYTIVSEEEGKPVMMLSIMYDELLANVDRLNDLDDEALAKIAATFQEEDEVEISYTETAHGTKLMVVKEVADNVDYVDFYTIYKGYELEFVLANRLGGEEAKSLSDEDIQLAIDFLSDLDFVAAE
jgi:hypothetical protein